MIKYKLAKTFLHLINIDVTYMYTNKYSAAEWEKSFTGSERIAYYIENSCCIT